MYEIYHADTHETAAMIQAKPFDYTLTGAAGEGVRRALELAEDLKQMNRTRASEGPAFEPTDGPISNDPTSLEGYQDPSPEYRLSWINQYVEPAYALREVPAGERAEAFRLMAARQYSEGDEVDTPDGVGVVVEIRTEDFEGPGGDQVEASDDSPAYVVGVEDGARVFRASDITMGEITVDGVDTPEADLADDEEEDEEGEAAEAYRASDATMGDTDVADFDAVDLNAQVDDGRTFDYPDSWDESPTPNRIILLKAWAGLGGRFTSCRREMTGEVTSPSRFCASMKDAVLNWEGWRQ